MLLKVIIVILFIGVVASLFGGLNFLVKDMGNSKKRLLYALGIRIGLAATLLAVIIYGTYSGQLSSKAPWIANCIPKILLPIKQHLKTKLQN